jgi:hypothetical protein
VRSAASRVRSIPGLVQYSLWPREARTPVFIFACQRSGTTMLLDVLERSPAFQVYQERSRAAYDASYRLRDEHTVERLIARGPGRAVVFKPLNDTQHADRILNTYAGAKAVWVYRGYRYVVQSAVKMWKGAQRDMLLGIASGDQRHPGQASLAEGMTADMVAECRRLCRQDLSAEDGAALHWYFRNLLYFERRLDRDGRVLLVKYEDLVTDPDRHFKRIFDFAGCRFTDRYVQIVRRAPRDRAGATVFRPDIEELCGTLLDRFDRLNAVHAAT